MTITYRADGLVALEWQPGTFITISKAQWQELRDAIAAAALADEQWIRRQEKKPR
jgi:hypothetical protein